MRKIRFFLLCLLLLFLLLCCVDGSQFILEEYSSVRSLQEESGQIEVKDPFDILPILFSISEDSSSLLLSRRFLEGRISYSGLSSYKPPFWSIPYLFRPFFDDRLKRMNMKAKEEEAEVVSFSEVESTYDSTSEISFIRKAITIDVDNASSVSYSLDGITFEPYNQPITADGPVDLTLEVAGDTGSNLFLSSGVTCSFEREGN